MAEFSRDSGDDDERFLTFKSGGRLYALPAVSVSEVVRLPPIARVPQAPRSLMGVANLRGSVLPVASVRALLGRDEAASTHVSSLSLPGGTSAVALAVDEVSSLVRVAHAKIRTTEADIAAEAGEHLRGVFESNADVVKILDVPELLRHGFARSTAAPKTADTALVAA